MDWVAGFSNFDSSTMRRRSNTQEARLINNINEEIL